MGGSTIMAGGEFSESTQGTVTGAISNMYDGDNATYYNFHVSSSGTSFLKWKFDVYIPLLNSL